MKDDTQKALFYAQEHLTCANYVVNREEGFSCIEFNPQQKEFINHMPNNYILFVITGKLMINSIKHGRKKLIEKQMLFIARNQLISLECEESSTILVAAFDRIKGYCNLNVYDSIKAHINDINYSMDPLFINNEMFIFLQSIMLYLQEKIGCVHIHNLKVNEMFMCLRFFYSKEDLAGFFYPIMSKSVDFKDFLMKEYIGVKNVQELIERSAMSKTVFYEKFSIEFGEVSPKQWLIEKKTERILQLASEPDMSVKMLAKYGGFYTVQQLQQYCKRHIGCYPSELLKRR